MQNFSLFIKMYYKNVNNIHIYGRNDSHDVDIGPRTNVFIRLKLGPILKI